MPIPVKIDDSVPADVAPRLMEGALSWNLVGLGDLVRPATPEDASPVVIQWVPKDDLFCGLAPSTIEIGSPCIIGRKVIIYASCIAKPGWEAIVAAHEMGHFLGLEHNADRRSRMYFQVIGPEQIFTVHDVAELRKRYAPR